MAKKKKKKISEGKFKQIHFSFWNFSFVVVDVVVAE